MTIAIELLSLWQWARAHNSQNWMDCVCVCVFWHFVCYRCDVECCCTPVRCTYAMSGQVTTAHDEWICTYVQWDNNNEANIRPMLSASVPSVHTARAKECVSGVRRMQSPKWILNYAWNFERLPDDRHIWTGPRECVHTVYNCLAVQLLHTNHHSPSRAMLSATAAVWFLFSINYAVSSYFISAWRILQFLANFGARARLETF